MFRIAWDEIYAHPLPEGHRFPMEKYQLIPQQLVYEGSIQHEQLFKPEAASEEDILRVHKHQYWEDLMNLSLHPKAIRKIGFPLSHKLVEREVIIAGGTIQACQHAKRDGISFNIAGGTHHAYAERGEGFCLLNDIAIAANRMLHHKEAERILVVDLDVHQGNGTACLFQEDSRVFTFSMHGADNYPLKKEKSDLDVALPKGTTGYVYLPLLEKYLQHIQQIFKPDFVFYLSGVDVLETDKLGKLALSIQECRTRDQLVLEYFHQLNIPMVVVMGGGYSPALRTIVEAHCNTYRLASSIFV